MTESIPLGPIPISHDVAQSERADAAANRARILAEAQALFAAHGVGAVTMADIAAAAEVGKGTLYRRYAGKGELCLALMDSQLRRFQDDMLDRFRQMTTHGQGPLGQLEAFMTSWVRFTEEQLPLMCEVQRDGLHADDHTAPYFWLHLTVVGLLRAAQLGGQVRRGVDIALAADLLLAPLRADMFRFLREGRGYGLSEIAAGLSAQIHGLT